ncbi:DJ-1/PfpI family protein [Nodosilinea sp. LEGE 07298]|uniref:DJ-1/PfpI family protein n=1 Tax=Nodosilinea sp. LEGE 07298 TaxID=2777970 RepID=UPI00187E9B47|nr:DJ-1/PfpI family protein [Nodosilinea sp. LEGE 07298]MBE9108529.1 DJ-1/PfpI family protein [Nodosilinea sp. LEGE 07298]
MDKIQIGFLIYPSVIQLDVMGAYQVLAFPHNTDVHLIGKTLTPIVSNEGVTLTPTVTLETCPPLDVICVPGGGMDQVEAMKDSEILNFLKQQSATAQYVTSVCTGSMILAAAGLLQGYKATCHWAFRDQLAALGVEVVPQRVVIDRNRITGAGVTSGIDFGLALLSLLCGEQIAKMAQLMMEYTPEPPFDAGTPETAGEEVMEALLQVGKPLVDAFWAQTQATAAQLKV